MSATRRNLIGLTAGLATATAVGVTTTSSPDATLIADCDEFTRRLKAANASAEDTPPAGVAQWDAIADRIIGAPTHTVDGVIARVRALAAAHGDFGASFDHAGGPQMMLAAIMRAVDPAIEMPRLG